MGLRVSGTEGLGYDLQNLLDGLSPASIKKALQNGSVPIMKQITANAPVKSGGLKAALATGRILQKGGRYYLKMGIFANTAPHAHLVENGHGGPHPAPPHPFMRPAFDATKDEAYSIIRQTLTEETKG